ncbi:hypothetical protein RHSIM_Rhsim02G0154700 [Rhododendron simsii]|uniref:Coatomer subunit zeta n=1 Tax=Rhododendron simsii TaxID=118357 RepID=A0A834HBX8_RHOSS|nr:hypothetical protein RHSIM_Rhsim02G0154700 [Rhododendron simsii]
MERRSRDSEKIDDCSRQQQQIDDRSRSTERGRDAQVEVEWGKLDDDVLVEAAEKGLFYRERIAVLPETGAMGGVLCAPDLANVGLRRYSPETTANCRGGGDSVFIVSVVVVGAESLAEEEGHFVRRVCSLRRRRWMRSCCCRGTQTVEEWGEESCPKVKNILLLDSEGKRVAVKYYSDDWPTNSVRETFEKAVFTKTQKTNARTEAEITMLESNIVVYKFVQDLHFFVTGGEDENEVILANVLQGFFDAVGLLLRGNVEKKEALENLDLILLCIDEIIDGGIVLETDANLIAGKVATHSLDSGAPLSEQTISQALATAREHLTRSLLK